MTRPLIQDHERFRLLLDEQYEWPARFRYKFIVKPDQVEALCELFRDAEASIRSSRRGRHVCVTLAQTVASADEVIAGYSRAEQIPGVISL